MRPLENLHQDLHLGLEVSDPLRQTAYMNNLRFVQGLQAL